MTNLQKVILIGLALMLGYLTIALLRKGGITTFRFTAICVVWIFYALLFFIKDKVQFVFTLFALAVSVATFGLQLAPLLVLRDLRVVEDGKKVYLYFFNKGAIPAYRMHGHYTITTHEERGEEIINERVLAFKALDVDDEAFYPSKDADDIDFISRRLDMSESFKAQQHNLYFSIRINYPRLEVWGLQLGLKGYEGVFFFDRAKNRWVKSSKTHLPEYSDRIFKALENKTPPFQ